MVRIGQHGEFWFIADRCECGRLRLAHHRRYATKAKADRKLTLLVNAGMVSTLATVVRVDAGESLSEVLEVLNA